MSGVHDKAYPHDNVQYGVNCFDVTSQLLLQFRVLDLQQVNAVATFKHTLTATFSPVLVTAMCTCAREAAAIGVTLNRSKLEN